MFCQFTATGADVIFLMWRKMVLYFLIRKKKISVVAVDYDNELY